MTKINTYPLKDLCIIEITDGTHKTPTYCENGYIFLSSKNVTSGKIDWDNIVHIPESLHDELYKRIAPQKDDILLAKNGTTGVAALVDRDEIFDIYVSLALIRPDKKKVLPKYLLHAINSTRSKEFFDGHLKGIGVPNLHLTHIRETPIVVPPLEQQQHIATVLDKVSELIDKRKKQLKLLDDLVKVRFVELFGDPKLNDKGWKSGILSDYFEVKGGKRIPKGMGYSDIKTNHPYLRATDMKNETILEDDIHYISEEVFQHIKRYTVNGGDIYLTNVGVNLGMAGVIPQKFDGASLTENAVKLVPKTERVIDGLFLAHYINSPGIQDYINERKMAVGVPKLAIFRIETMPLLIPPMEVQQDFIAFVKQTDKSKFVVQKALDEAQLLFDSLMQKYFGDSQ